MLKTGYRRIIWGSYRTRGSKGQEKGTAETMVCRIMFYVVFLGQYDNADLSYGQHSSYQA